MTDFERLRVAFTDYLLTMLGRKAEWMVQDLLDIVEKTEKEAKT